MEFDQELGDWLISKRFLGLKSHLTLKTSPNGISTFLCDEETVESFLDGELILKILQEMMTRWKRPNFPIPAPLILKQTSKFAIKTYNWGAIRSALNSLHLSQKIDKFTDNIDRKSDIIITLLTELKEYEIGENTLSVPIPQTYQQPVPSAQKGSSRRSSSSNTHRSSSLTQKDSKTKPSDMSFSNSTKEKKRLPSIGSKQKKTKEAEADAAFEKNQQESVKISKSSLVKRVKTETEKNSKVDKEPLRVSLTLPSVRTPKASKVFLNSSNQNSSSLGNDLSASISMAIPPMSDPIVDLNHLGHPLNPSKAKTILEFFITSISVAFQLSPPQSAQLLTHQFKYIAHIISKGMNGSFVPVHAFFSLLLVHSEKISSLCLTSTENWVYIFGILKPGLMSRCHETASLSVSVMGLMAGIMVEERGMLSEGIQVLRGLIKGMLLCISRRPELSKPIATLMTVLAGERRKDAMTKSSHVVVVPESVVDQLLREASGSLKEYFENLRLLLPGLIEAGQMSDSSIRSSIYQCTELLGSRASSPSSNSQHLSGAALSFLVDIWTSFPQLIESDSTVSHKILTQFRQRCKDAHYSGSSTNSKKNSLPIRISSLIQLTRIISHGSQVNNVVFYSVLKTILQVFVDAVSSSQLREIAAQSLLEILRDPKNKEAIDNLPGSAFAVPLAQMVQSNEGRSLMLNTFDMDMLRFAVEMKSLEPAEGVGLLDVLIRLGAKSVTFGEDALKMVQNLIKRFRSCPEVTDCSLRLMKFLCNWYMNFAKRPHPLNKNSIKKREFDFEKLQGQRRGQTVQLLKTMASEFEQPEIRCPLQLLCVLTSLRIQKITVASLGTDPDKGMLEVLGATSLNAQSLYKQLENIPESQLAQHLETPSSLNLLSIRKLISGDGVSKEKKLRYASPVDPKVAKSIEKAKMLRETIKKQNSGNPKFNEFVALELPDVSPIPSIFPEGSVTHVPPSDFVPAFEPIDISDPVCEFLFKKYEKVLRAAYAKYTKPLNFEIRHLDQETGLSAKNSWKLVKHEVIFPNSEKGFLFQPLNRVSVVSLFYSVRNAKGSSPELKFNDFFQFLGQIGITLFPGDLTATLQNKVIKFLGKGLKHSRTLTIKKTRNLPFYFQALREYNSQRKPIVQEITSTRNVPGLNLKSIRKNSKQSEKSSNASQSEEASKRKSIESNRSGATQRESFTISSPIFEEEFREEVDFKRMIPSYLARQLGHPLHICSEIVHEIIYNALGVSWLMERGFRVRKQRMKLRDKETFKEISGFLDDLFNKVVKVGQRLASSDDESQIGEGNEGEDSPKSKKDEENDSSEEIERTQSLGRKVTRKKKKIVLEKDKLKEEEEREREKRGRILMERRKELLELKPSIEEYKKAKEERTNSEEDQRKKEEEAKKEERSKYYEKLKEKVMEKKKREKERKEKEEKEKEEEEEAKKNENKKKVLELTKNIDSLILEKSQESKKKKEEIKTMLLESDPVFLEKKRIARRAFVQTLIEKDKEKHKGEREAIQRMNNLIEGQVYKEFCQKHEFVLNNVFRYYVKRQDADLSFADDKMEDEITQESLHLFLKEFGLNPSVISSGDIIGIFRESLMAVKKKANEKGTRFGGLVYEEFLKFLLRLVLKYKEDFLDSEKEKREENSDEGVQENKEDLDISWTSEERKEKEQIELEETAMLAMKGFIEKLELPEKDPAKMLNKLNEIVKKMDIEKNPKKDIFS